MSDLQTAFDRELNTSLNLQAWGDLMLRLGEAEQSKHAAIARAEAAEEREQRLREALDVTSDALVAFVNAHAKPLTPEVTARLLVQADRAISHAKEAYWFKHTELIEEDAGDRAAEALRAAGRAPGRGEGERTPAR